MIGVVVLFIYTTAPATGASETWKSWALPVSELPLGVSARGAVGVAFVGRLSGAEPKGDPLGNVLTAGAEGVRKKKYHPATPRMMRTGRMIKSFFILVAEGWRVNVDVLASLETTCLC